MACAVRTPVILLSPVWPLPRSLAATYGISVDFFSSAYLDVSVQGVPHAYLLIQYTLHDSSSWVFPHSEICGSRLICSSPQLIAACHVLLRLLMPRHSLYALLSLNSSIVMISHTYRFSILLLELLCITFFQLLINFRSGKIVFLFYPLLERPDFKLICYLCLFPFLLNF